MKLPELLAPVSSMEHLKIAINAGASSVYLSGKKYGARKFAENFTLDEISKATDLAHLYNVKVYVTVNTLIMEDELEEVIDYIAHLYAIGIDAILIQDLGLIEVIRKNFPDLHIHASTQMNLENQLKLDYVEKKGIKRVVLPREMSYEEIKNLNTNMELEIFVHGALCYCYSGQCYMSSFKGGRSGNRGECAQPCRKKYQLTATNKNKNYLSPKDLSLFNYLEEIVELGIDCIKIEGRMRNEQYLTIVVSEYRKALNKLKSNKKYDSEDLELVFNRGHTPGQFKRSSSRSLQAGHLGLNIGKVVKTKKNQIAVKLKDYIKTIPEKGDGLLITDGFEKYGFEVSKQPIVTTENNFKKNKIKPLKDFNRKNRMLILKQVKQNKKNKYDLINSNVYLTKRNSLNKKVKEVKTKSTSYIESELSMIFSIKNNYPILKAALKSRGNTIKDTVKGTQQVQKPKKHATTIDTIKKQLSKMDNYPFKVKNINVKYNEDKFIPMSELNKLRREVLNNLEEKLIESYKRPLKKIKLEPSNKQIIDKNLSLSYYTNNLKQLEKINNVQRVYLEIPAEENKIYNYQPIDTSVNYMVTFLENAFKIAQDKEFQLIWKWPDIAHDNLIKKLMQTKGILNKKGIEFKIMNSDFDGQIGPYSLNITNNESIKSLDQYDLLTLSVELKKKDFEDIIKNTSNNSKLEILVQGNVELMKTRNKLLPKSEAKHVNQEKNTFIVDNNGNKYSIKENLSNEELIILDFHEISLLEEISYLKSINYINFAIDGRWKDDKYLKMIDIYNDALNGDCNINRLIKISDKNTKGNY